MKKNISKIFLYAVLMLVILIVGVSLFTQTSMFRKTFRSTLYTFLKSEINADMYIGTINGNLITGFSIDTVMMYIDGAPFVEAGKLTVHYNIFSILNNTIAIDSLTLENPSVNLIRWQNGEWNIDHLSTSTSPDDSTDSPLVITAGKLRIINAQFHLTDSTGEYGKSAVDRNGKPVINYSNIDVERVNIEVSGMFSAKELDIAVKHLSFISPREKFTLSKLSTTISRTEEKTSVKNLIIITPASRIETSVALNEIDAFSIDDIADLRRAQISLSISSSNVNSGDIEKFFPPLDFLEGKIYFDGDLEGNFENLTVKKLNAAFGKTSISLSGTVSNIYKPEELRLNIVSSKCTINPTDVPSLMPYFGIPDYKNLGIVTLDFQFVGKPNDFLAISKIKSIAGTVTVDGQVIITEENIHYKGIIAGNDVNLEKVFASNDFASRLNTRIFIEGEGTTIATLNSEATIEIDSSMFRNIPLGASTIQLKASDKKIEGDISIHSTDGNIKARGLLDFNDEQMPSYFLSANVRGLDLSPVLGDDYYSSRLSFDIERTGKGLTLFDNPSETKIDFHNSNFNGMSFDSAQVVMTWLKDSLNQNRVIVRSPVVDAAVEGTFTFNGMIRAIETQLSGLDRIYTYQRSIVDSLFVTGTDPVAEGVDLKIDPSSISYDLTMKNLKPLSVFFDFPMLEIVGKAQGTISSDTTSASSTGTIAVAQGMYADTTTPIHLNNLSLNYILNNISPKRLITVEDPLEISLTLLSDEINISGTALRLSKLMFDFNRQKGSYNFVTDVDTMLSVAMDGKVEVSDYLNRFAVANFNAKYQGFELRNATPFVATATRSGFRIDSSVFLRGEEEFIVKGMYDYRGAVNANAVIKNFELSDIFFVSVSPEFREQVFAMGGTVNAVTQISGTVKNPVILATLEGKNISYRNSNFGDLRAEFNYSEKMAAIKVQLNETNDYSMQNNFNLQGVVPINLSFTSVDDRTNIQGMDINLIAANLPVDIFDVFIPEIDQLKGRATGSIHATGSLNNPLMIGSIQLDSGIFRLEMTGIQYEMKGRIVLDTQKISFRQFSISNLVPDYSEGTVNVAGYISLNGYAPSEYHLNANGELLVLQDRSRTANQSFFGTLITRTGKNGLRFEGTFERSRIIGEILVQDAFLTFPPTQQTGSFSSSRFDDVIYIDDTSKQIIDTSAVNAFFQAAGVTVGEKDKKRSFLDGFGYDLIIETQGNVRVNMIFNAEVGAYEELYAELNGKMTLKKDEESRQLIGTINVGEGSTYEFYKKFNASGSLKFVGDPQNPQLNIIAKYEGTHCVNPTLKDECPIVERVIVVLYITGTRLDPKLKIGLYTIDQNDREIVRQGDVENDAIAFLLTSSAGSHGRFRDDLTGDDRNRLGDQLTEAIGGTFINSMLSEFVMEFIKKNNIPFVKRIELRGVTQKPTETDINITGELSTAVINVGGRVFTDLNNANISIQIPVLGKQNRNFMFEVEKKTESYETSIQARTILGARLFYRFTF